MQKLFRERQERRLRISDRLGKLSEAALMRELQILAEGGFSTDDLQALTNARMKAIQQLELLEGRATSRVDYGMEQMLAGVALAFRAILPLITARVGQEFADEITALFADKLREAREETERLVLEPPIEDAEYEPIDGEAAA